MPNETSGAMPPVSPIKKDYSALYLPGAILVAGLMIAIGLFFGLAGGKSAGIQGQPEPRKVDAKEVKTAGVPFIGKENAPLTMAYWFDYQCPFCKAVDVGHPQIPTQPSMPMLIKDYVETGKLKIYFKDYAFLGPDSMAAAEYKHAVWEMYPDKFYEWHEAMFHAQDEEHGGFGNEESILALIKKIPGMDANKLKALVAQKKSQYDADIAAEQQEGAKFGIQGTPGFIIGKQAIDGAVGPEQFKAAIDSQL
jgi:protein-disulfide isomerase